MAYTYEIKLKTSVGAELARAHLLATGRFTRYEDALNGGGTHIVMKRYDPSAPGDARYQDYYEDYFGFRPDLGVTISLNKFERMEEAERTAVEVVALLAREVGEMSRATYTDRTTSCSCRSRPCSCSTRRGRQDTRTSCRSSDPSPR